MSADKEKMSQLVQKIDELLMVLKEVSEDLKTVSSSMKSLAVAQITAKPVTNPPKPVSPVPKQVTPSVAPAVKPTIPATAAPYVHATSPVSIDAKTESIEDIRIMFPEDLDNMLSFEDKGEYVIIKPKQFLGSENFAKIASTVRGIGGEYISAGRESHFRVYKKKA
jgi:hypothetical protein